MQKYSNETIKEELKLNCTHIHCVVVSVQELIGMMMNKKRKKQEKDSNYDGLGGGGIGIGVQQN